jgi:adenine-specific DNA methylase
MGSKRAMLSNGLGEILRSELEGVARFADLFAGSSAVSWFAAANSECAVLAGDLQLFSVALARGVISRTKPLNAGKIWTSWEGRAESWLSPMKDWAAAEELQIENWQKARRRTVERARNLCGQTEAYLTRAYGGHYFSPKQALNLDALRATLPDSPGAANAALAALISAASQCAGAPGHTAQPFQPTKKAAKFLFEAWHRDVRKHVRSALENICSRHANAAGHARVSEAQKLAEKLRGGDLAFVDPPYSGVHYSRFYHVLESIARGYCTKIEGTGRYPDPAERPKSDFSIASKSKSALDALFSTLSKNRVRTIVTYPAEKTSNGLSGAIVRKIAKKYFKIEKSKTVNGRFSTLGGNLTNRKARIPAYELILVLSPRPLQHAGQ